MRIDWQRQISAPLAVCIALAFYVFAIALGIWLVTR